MKTCDAVFWNVIIKVYYIPTFKRAYELYRPTIDIMNIVIDKVTGQAKIDPTKKAKTADEIRDAIHKLKAKYFYFLIKLILLD